MKTLSTSELERLALLVEECAEVQQIAMKIIRHGYNSHNPFDEYKTPNGALLNKELGDLTFVIQLMSESDDIDDGAIKGYAIEKRARVRAYLHHNKV